MPSTSAKQHRFMEAVAHNPKFAKKAGVPQSVGQDFADADRGRKFAMGGPVPMMGGPLALTQVPGVATPQAGMQHPMASMVGGLRGAMQLADHHAMTHGPRLRQMQRGFAKGGKAKSHKLGDHGRKAIHHAIQHLKKGDHQSAISTLQSSPEAMQHPDVQAILGQLTGGGAPASTGADASSGGSAV